MSFFWKKIGSISIADDVESLRFFGNGYLACHSPQYGGSYYKVFDTYYNPSTGVFSSSQIYSQVITDIISAWPITGGFVYQTNTGVYIRYLGSTYTLQTWNTGSISALDASPELNVAYSFRGTGGSGRFLKFGEFSFDSGLGFIDTGLYGPTSISRNGLYATVSGDPTGGNNRKTIKVFTSSNGSVSWPFTPIQLGNTIQISGTSNIEVVKINNAGTRLVAYTFSNIYTYELISGSWVERPSIAPPPSNNIKGISLSSTGGILVTRGDSVVNSYVWDSGANSWQLVDETSIALSSYYGSKIDISSDAMYMAVDVWPTTNSRAIEIYQKINSPQIYKGSSQSRQAYFGVNPCRVYYGAKEL